MPVHRYSILIVFIPIKIKAGSFATCRRKCHRKAIPSQDWSRRVWEAVLTWHFWHKLKDTETTKDKTIHVDFFQLLQKTPNEIALKRSYSASYKQDPVSSSTQQHKKNIRENRKTTEVPPDNAGTRTDGIMEQWSLIQSGRSYTTSPPGS